MCSLMQEEAACCTFDLYVYTVFFLCKVVAVRSKRERSLKNVEIQVVILFPDQLLCMHNIGKIRNKWYKLFLAM